jgi:hypothetical protein
MQEYWPAKNCRRNTRMVATGFGDNPGPTGLFDRPPIFRPVTFFTLRKILVGTITSQIRYKSGMQSSSSTLDAAPQAVQVEISTVEVRRRWFELFLVLFVACGSPLLYSLYLLIKGPGVFPQVSDMRWLGGLLQEVSSLFLPATFWRVEAAGSGTSACAGRFGMSEWACS